MPSQRTLTTLVLALAGQLSAADTATRAVQESPPRQRRITISCETTRIREPLTVDGYPDYTEALDREYREGVTPENNAAVLLFQAFGPEVVPERLRASLATRLDVDPFLADEGRIVPAARLYGKWPDEPALYEELIEAGMAPWRAGDRPAIARLIAENERPLQRIVEASRRPRYYVPLDLSPVGGRTTPLADPPLDVLRLWRTAERLLAARAMLRIGTADGGGAWDDLATIHRLARLIASDPDLGHALVSGALHATACRGTRCLVLRGGLSAKEVHRMLEELDRLPPLPDFVEKLDRGLRYEHLDTAVRIAEGNVDTWEALTGSSLLALRKPVLDAALFNSVLDAANWNLGTSLAAWVLWREADRRIIWLDSLERSRPWSVAAPRIALALTDWDQVMQDTNDLYDRYLRVLRLETWSQRRLAYEALDREFRRRSALVEDCERIMSARLLGVSERTIVSQLVSNKLMVNMVPPLGDVSERLATSLQLTRTTLALGAFRADHGRWPDELTELLPDYLVEVPRDPYGDGPLHYRADDEGFVLYSVGDNARDDGGHNLETGALGADDNVVRYNSTP